MTDKSPCPPPPMAPTHNIPNNGWMYGMYQYNGYGGGMYQQYYNNYFNQMPYAQHNYQNMNNMNLGMNQSIQKDGKNNFVNSQFPPLPPPSSPLLGVAPLNGVRPNFLNQSPVRFNFNQNRKPNGLQPSNPLTGNNSGSNKKKRKKNKNNQANNNYSAPPLPVDPPPLPPCPPPLDTPKPPPPPLDVPLPPPPPTITPDCIDVVGNEVQTIGQDTPITDEPPKTAPKSNIFDNQTGVWPESLYNYIQRCYKKCTTNFDRDQIEICLKGRITAAASKDELWVRNWDEEPIPSVHSERNNLVVKTVPGTLAHYQKVEPSSPAIHSAPLKTLPASLSSRLGVKRSPPARRRRDRSYSRSRSHSHSPRRKRRSPSLSSSSDENVIKIMKTNKNKPRGRPPLESKKNNAKQAKAQKKKAAFYEQFRVGGDVEGNSERLQQRAARFGGSGLSNVPTIASSMQPNHKRNKVEPVYRKPIIEDTQGDFDWDGCHVVGTCVDVEKSFLRLTKAPEACDVRPAAVLMNSLKHVKERWIVKQDYRYACDQLKSIRQDLTVQGIRDAFTVNVYEAHAMIALEKGDHEEFNQCQTQLRMLYSELPACRQNVAEFTAYRILYYVFTKNTLDITTMFKSLTAEEKENECISYALKARGAWATGNLHRFFKLYKGAPRMAGYLMDWFLERERKIYLKYIIKSFRQTVPVDYITGELAFDSDQETLEFLAQFGLTYTGTDQTSVDCKTSSAVLANF